MVTEVQGRNGMVKDIAEKICLCHSSQAAERKGQSSRSRNILPGLSLSELPLPTRADLLIAHSATEHVNG